jgi:hypothetical protein
MGGSFTSQPAGDPVAQCPAARKSIYWLEIELVGEDSKPIPSARYQVRLPDGKVVDGYLDREGFARLDGLTAAGQCQVRFPELDAEAWDFLETLGPKEAQG